MRLTTQNLFDALTPLFLALHEKNLIGLGELQQLYEDVIARRKIDNQEDEASLAFLQGVAVGIHRLAAQVRPPTPDR